MWDTFMQLPHGLIFNTPEEKKFFRRRFSTAERDGPTIGIGVDAPTEFHVPPFLRKYSLHDPFLLYVGRIDASKGCAELFDFFRRLRESDTEPRKLVLLGNEVMTVPYHPDIIRLGFVADQEKFAAMAACDWLVNPSPYESLSIVLLETWLAGRPALVNAACEVLVGQCRRSNGGLWYSNYAEWQQAILSVDSATRSMIGQQGKEYVEREYSWDRIESCYRAAVDANGTSPRASSAVSVSAP
jgi:glycosyltransferase involved in cell wall biosynthesis